MSAKAVRRLRSWGSHGFDEFDYLASPSGSVVLVSDSGAHPAGSPNMDEDMLLTTSSDELDVS